MALLLHCFGSISSSTAENKRLYHHNTTLIYIKYIYCQIHHLQIQSTVLKIKGQILLFDQVFLQCLKIKVFPSYSQELRVVLMRMS